MHIPAAKIELRFVLLLITVQFSFSHARQFRKAHHEQDVVNALNSKVDQVENFRKFSEVSMIMTHNSLSQVGLVSFANQRYTLAEQFDMGIRGFNLDLYTKGSDQLNTYHGFENKAYDPTDQIKDLVRKIQGSRASFVVIQLQDSTNSATFRKFLELFKHPRAKTSLITNFNPGISLASYIQRNQQILLLTPRSSNVDESRGSHSTKKYLIENDYKWSDPFCLTSFPSSKERYPGQSVYGAAVLMNNFCASVGLPNESDSRSVNSRILYHIRKLGKCSYVGNSRGGTVNIVMVDYFEQGSVFDALLAMHDGDITRNCWDDRYCLPAGSCWNCCDGHTWKWFFFRCTAGHLKC